MALYASKMMRVAAIAAATALALSACGKGDEKAAGQQAQGSQQQQKQPAPEVRVVTVHPETVALTTELPGRLESLRTAEVRAQVGGICKNACSKRAAMLKLVSLCTKSTARLMKQT